MQDDARECKIIQDNARCCKMMQDNAGQCKMMQRGLDLCDIWHKNAICIFATSCMFVAWCSPVRCFFVGGTVLDAVGG
jgi:hypothetical protein